jgi:ferredoxin-NADP reductase
MTYTVEVEDVTQLTRDVKEFRLRSDGHEFEYEPGHHTHIHFDAADADVESDGDDSEVVRPYTATNLPSTDGLTLAIRRYDDGTASVWMHEREAGDEIAVDDVDGNLHLRNFDEDVVFVATGTGITPMAPMLKQYAEEGEGEAHLLFGEKTEEDLIYREEFDRLASEHGNVNVHYSLSDEDWDGLEGHVQEHVPDVLDSLDDRDYYVCGVPGMVVDAKEKLTEDLDVPEDRVFAEGWEEDQVDSDSSDS